MKVKEILKECYNMTEEEAQEKVNKYDLFRFPDNRQFKKKIMQIIQKE